MFRAVLLFAFAVLATRADAAPPSIQPHRALYELTLDHAQKGSDILGAGGQLYFEWADVCDGWAVVQRYKLRLFFSGSEDLERQISFASWEAKNGRRYRFEVKKLKNDEIDEDIRGVAQLPKGKPGSVLFAVPEGTYFPLSREVLFPSAHMIAILEAAKAKQNFLAKPVFDGGSPEGPSTVSVAIGAARFEKDKHVHPLLKGRSWAMRMAFFQDSSGVDPQTQGEKLPDYELGADMLENGISRSMLLDYGSFAIKAKLLSIEPLTKPKCS